MAKKAIEKDVQDRFFDILIDQKEGFNKTPIEVYQKLVLYRYEEVIRNALPLFLEHISAKKFEKTIKKFMKATPSTPFVWQIPNDYRKFVKRSRLFDNKKYLYELMYYDWIEVELYMTEYRLKKQRKFKYANFYKLSKSARVKRFEYDIVGNDYSSKRENYMVIYYDFDLDDIIYREINPLLFYTLKCLNKKQSFEEILEKLCLENEIDVNEAKQVLKEPFNELYEKRVFT